MVIPPYQLHSPVATTGDFLQQGNPTVQCAHCAIQTVTVDSISAIHTQTLFEALVNDQLPKIGNKTKIHLSICWGHQGVRKTGGWLFAVAA